MPFVAASTRDAAGSAEYWRGIFLRNPEFCSWQGAQQRQVLDLVRSHLTDMRIPLRVLDFGVGSLGLYRNLGDDLMRGIALTGISESQQHDPADPLFARYRIRVLVGPGLQPLASVPDSSQDVVICTYVFAYLEQAARDAALKAFARVLQPGGRLLLVLHHPKGERARKFRDSASFWPQARAVYSALLRRHDAEARARLARLDDVLTARFTDDPEYRRYLASYLKTARRFLALYSTDGGDAKPAAAAALFDCENTQRLIDREFVNTCQSFHPVADPARDLLLPPALSLSQVTECVDPRAGAPIANVLTAHKTQIVSVVGIGAARPAAHRSGGGSRPGSRKDIECTQGETISRRGP